MTTINEIESQLDQWSADILKSEKALAQAEGRHQTNIERLNTEFKINSVPKAKQFQTKLIGEIKTKKAKAEKDFALLVKYWLCG